MYSLLLAVIYLAFISLGLPDSLLGSGWPAMQQVFGVPLASVGIVSMIISGGTILSSLFSERMVKRFGTGKVTAASVFLTAAALFGFSFSTKFALLCVWAVPYGLGAGAIDAALNNYVAMHYSSRHMSWLHCFWGVGTIVSPVLMSYALSHTIWNDGYRFVAYIQSGIVLVLLCTLPMWKNAQSVTTNVGASRVLGLRRTLRIPGVPCLLVGFFAYCSAESVAMLWASSYLVRVHGTSTERAAAFASLFFIGMTVGRFLSGFVAERIGDRGMIRLGIGIALCGALLLFLPLGEPTAILGLIVTGLGCAPIYPSIIHSTPKTFGAEYSQAIIGVQMASAYVGSTFSPPLFGLIAERTTLYLLPVWLIAFLVLSLVLLERAARSTDKKRI